MNRLLDLEFERKRAGKVGGGGGRVTALPEAASWFGARGGGGRRGAGEGGALLGDSRSSRGRAFW